MNTKFVLRQAQVLSNNRAVMQATRAARKRSLPLTKEPPKFDMKYFITRATILRVYREALQLAYQAGDDEQSREHLLTMMKDEFRPFRQARDQGKLLTQDAVDYNLAMIRQTINQLKEMVKMSR